MIDRLRKVAEATDAIRPRCTWEATHGAKGWYVWPVANIWDQGDDSAHVLADHIAMFDPPTVLALLDIVQAAQAASSAWEVRMASAFLEHRDGPDLSEIDDLMYGLREALARLGGDTP